jgi:hypothetical protein
LNVGEWVEIRGAEEILASLDADKCVDGLPFMPEMLQYCGKRFRVFKSAHKTADTMELFTIRRMADAVHLGDLRCDGSRHGGCQAGCLFFWKERWLKRIPDEQAAETSAGQMEANQDASSPPVASEELLSRAAKVVEGTRERYRCQATQMLEATSTVRRWERWNPFFYVRDLTSGNVSVFDVVRFGTLAAINAFLLRWFGFRLPIVRGFAKDEGPSRALNLQAGEWVRVLPKSEIEQTLNSQLRNHGMWFDVEMLPYCGKGPFRVRNRVERILDEKTGRLLKLRDPSIILDAVTCSGNRLHRRMFSPRHEFPFWKEIWLERTTAPEKLGGENAQSP